MANIEGSNIFPGVEFEFKAEECGFCKIPETQTTEYFRDLHGDLPHTLQIPNLPSGFSALQDVVPIAEKGGHIMLMPNSHHISLASIDSVENLKSASSAIEGALQQYFPENPIFVFEHGPGFIEGEPIACGGCHMDHAHGHYLLLPKGTALEPIRSNMETVLLENGWPEPQKESIPSNEIFTNIADVAGMSPYLHIGMIDRSSGERSSFTYIQRSTSFNVPSQLLRAVIADQVYGQQDPTYWHWRDVHMGLTFQDREDEVRRDVVEFRNITGF